MPIVKQIQPIDRPLEPHVPQTGRLAAKRTQIVVVRWASLVDDPRKTAQVAVETRNWRGGPTLEERSPHETVVHFFLVAEEDHEGADLERPVREGGGLPCRWKDV